MRNTTWYNLNKPQGTDVVDVTKLNANMDTIDQELHKAQLTADNQADAYDDTATYEVGDLVIYGNVLYKCTTAIDTAESWDAAHWQQTTLANAIGTGGGGGGGASTLGELSDVNITSPTDGQVIKYDAASQKWVNGADSGGSSGANYSTNEQVIGTWIDGKPLYEKTLECGALPNINTKTIAHNISNLKSVLDFRGVAVSRTGPDSSRPIPFATMDSNTIRIDCNDGTIRVITYSDWSSYNGYLTIRYTKTTD